MSTEIKRMKLKDLKNEALRLCDEGISNQEKLREALPYLIALQAAITNNSAAVSASRKAATELSKACTDYAVKHESVFEAKKLIANQQGVRTGDIITEDAIYHLACGYSGYVRTNGEVLKQDFLKALPEGWAKTRVELDVTGINEACPSDEELAEHGLKQKENNVWSAEKPSE